MRAEPGRANQKRSRGQSGICPSCRQRGVTTAPLPLQPNHFAYTRSWFGSRAGRTLQKGPAKHQCAPIAWGCFFSALPVLPAPEPALQGFAMSVLVGEHPLPTPQALGTPQLTVGTTYIGSLELGSTPAALASVLCPGKSHGLHCFNPGHRALVTHRWGELQREGTDTEALRSVFPASAYFQGAPVPHRATQCDGRCGKEQAASKGSHAVGGASRHWRSEPGGDNIREGFITASLLPKATFITSMSLMKRRLYFLGSMNPPIVTCLLSGKSGLSLPELV